MHSWAWDGEIQIHRLIDWLESFPSDFNVQIVRGEGPWFELIPLPEERVVRLVV